MKYFVLGANYVVRLDPGEKIVEALKALCERDAIGAGYFNGLGAVINGGYGMTIHFKDIFGILAKLSVVIRNEYFQLVMLLP